VSHVLVTGGDGLVGSHVVDELLARCHGVRVLDVLHPAALAAAPACRNPDADHRLGDVRHVFADPALARRELGFSAGEDFAAGMAEFASAELRERTR